MECISQAKHFIYIENQFFSKGNRPCGGGEAWHWWASFYHIVSATDQDKLLRNKIAQALVERIIRAHEEQEKFKVFIIIPLVSSGEK